MSDEKPNPFEDVRKGLGLLFRAAKTTVEKLPKKDFEEVVMTSAREVGRAFENVGRTIEREVLGRRGEAAAPPSAKESSDAPPRDAKATGGEHPADKPEEPKPPDAA
jgi:hypothetical protein